MKGGTTNKHAPADRLQVFQEKNPHLVRFTSMLDELNKESPRGMVLVATSFLDNLTKDILSAFLIEGKDRDDLLSGFFVPLGTHSTRTAAAFSLGLISEQERNESTTLRKIRNRFAHDVHASFEDNDIKQFCRNLSMAAADYGDHIVSSQGRFSTAATCLILNLTNRPFYVSKKRRKLFDWPR